MRRAQVDWIANGKNITTRSGTFIGYAASKDHAALLVACIHLVQQLERENKELIARLEQLIEQIKN